MHQYQHATEDIKKTKADILLALVVIILTLILCNLVHDVIAQELVVVTIVWAWLQHALPGGPIMPRALHCPSSLSLKTVGLQKVVGLM